MWHPDAGEGGDVLALFDGARSDNMLVDAGHLAHALEVIYRYVFAIPPLADGDGRAAADLLVGRSRDP